MHFHRVHKLLIRSLIGFSFLTVSATVWAQETKGRGDRPKTATTDTGKPVGDDVNSLTAGAKGPTLLENFYLLEKLAHFDRERIPERVVHARGLGVHGEFVCTHDVTGLTRADFLSEKGKKTPVFTRFSVVVLPRGSAETARDVRGFAVKFYTNEGNYDLVGNDIPVFFIRDAIKFPDLVHSLKPSPVTNVQEPGRYFDFFAAMPETTHMLTYLFADQGTPASYRTMDGFGVHAFKWVNAKGEARYVKYRWKSAQGTKYLTDAEAKRIAGEEPAALTKEFKEALDSGACPSWELQVQVVTPEELKKFGFNGLDVTKDWPETLVKFQPVGKMTLTKLPDNFFEATEQVAFNTGAYVPGVEPSEDKLLQGRNFSYSDTQRHRLGPNYQQLPINQPLHPVVNNNQEGLNDHMHKKGDINYNPSFKEPNRLQTDERSRFTPTPLAGNTGYAPAEDPQDFGQAGDRIRTLSATDRDHLLQNLTIYLKQVKEKPVVAKIIEHFTKADAAFGADLAKSLGMAAPKVVGAAGR